MASIRPSIVGSALVGAAAAFALGGSADAQTPPNVVLIIMDDTSVDLFGAYNEAWQEVAQPAPPAPIPEHAATPNIDALANEGVLFRNAWATPYCKPTRTTMFTGLYGYRTGTVFNDTTFFDAAVHPTLAGRLRDETVYAVREAIGKWHMSNYNPLPDYSSIENQDSPVGLGFTRQQGHPGSQFPAFTYKWPSIFEVPLGQETGPVPIPTYDASDEPDPDPDYVTTREIDTAIAFVEQSHASPWFLWLALHAAHSPWQNAVTPTPEDTPCTSSAIPTSFRRVRCRQLQLMDAGIGDLMAAIRVQDPELTNTVVILLGDNGGEASVKIPGTINRAGKGSLYEGGINVPLIVAGAGVSDPDPETIREVPTLVHSVDVFATVLDVAGVPVEAIGGDGVSFEPVLSDTPGVTRSCVYTDGSVGVGGTHPSDHEVAIRNLTHKLIRRAPNDDDPYEFYDLVNDPSEGTQLPESGAIFDGLKAELDRIDQDPTLSPCKPGQSGCGFGVELIPALGLLFALRRRARRL